MYFNVLDAKRQNILSLFSNNFSSFYLAGGTALALHFGHRKSIDFDFFTVQNFESTVLQEEAKKIFKNHGFIVQQQEKNTLSFLVDGEIQISFFSYPYPLLEPLLKTNFFDVASVLDISAMKCLAIVQRATQKDYIDMFFILQKLSLSDVLNAAKQKFPEISEEVILRSMVYFEDVKPENIEFLDIPLSWETIQSFLEKTVSHFFQK